MKRNTLTIMRNIIFILILAFSISLFGDEPSVPESTIFSWMEELKPLPKVHYSWPLPYKKISQNVLFEYVRLTHAASLSGEWCKPEDIDMAVEACQHVNALNPKIPASLGVNYSVWHRRFEKNTPPTNTGSTHDKELNYLQTRMEAIRDGLASANQKHKAAITVTAILFDSERFRTKVGNKRWNASMTQKYNAAYDVVQKIFPNARIEWYSRGAAHLAATDTGWNESSHFALDEKGEFFSCSLYQVPEIGNTREIFRRTAANAEQHDCKEVTPWIALASGYRRQTDKYHSWSNNWNYDLIYSWKLGREINNAWYGTPERAERFAPWHLAKIVIFYPQPFGKSPHWGQHFVAYVRGANGIKQLPYYKQPTKQTKGD